MGRQNAPFNPKRKILMLLNILMGEGSFALKILELIICMLALLPALTFHEWAHGYSAYRLGDNTAKYDGRLSMNPLDHIDPIGTLMLLLVGFGWAKPVPINTRNFKKPRRDIAITSLAGPLMNFIVAFISVLLMVLCEYVFARISVSVATYTVITNIFFYSAMFNIGLGTFNLIPLPPLDGSNILMCILPNKLAMEYSKIKYYSHYIFIALIILRRLPFLDVFGWLDNLRTLLFMLFYNLGNSIIWPFFEFI